MSLFPYKLSLRAFAAACDQLKRLSMRDKRAGARLRAGLTLCATIALVLGLCFIPFARTRAAAASSSGFSLTSLLKGVEDSYRLSPGHLMARFLLLQNTTADLSVTKGASPLTPVAGADVTYAIEVRNNGPGQAANVTLTDVLPAGMSFISMTQESGPGFSCSGPSQNNTISCSISLFNANDVATFTLVARVPANAATGTQFENTATVTSSTSDANPNNNTAKASVTVAGSADLSVTKTATPESTTADTDVTYTIEVRNNGPGSSADVTLNDLIPANMTFVSFTQNSGPAFSCQLPNQDSQNNTVTCTNSLFAAGSVATFTFVGHIPSGTEEGTYFTNTASVTSETTDFNQENNTATAASVVAARTSDLAVSKTSTTITARADTNVTYTIEVRNNGPNPAQDFNWTDTLPSAVRDNVTYQMTFVSLTQNSGPTLNCTTPAAGTHGTINCTTSSFPAGAIATFTLVAHIPSGVPDALEFTNVATVGSDWQDPVEENNSSAAAVTVVDCFTSYLVTSNADSGAGTLREGIQQVCRDGTITFATNLSSITLTSDELVIDKNLTIQGLGANLLTVQRSTAQGTPNFRIFTINSGVTATIKDLTITNGRAVVPSGSEGGLAQGGGIRNSGTLALTRVAVSGNTATSEGFSGGGTGQGGGIYNAGTLTVTSSLISNNTATGGFAHGGGIYHSFGTVTVNNSTISGNTALAGVGTANGQGRGGGIFIFGNTVTLANSTVANNSASDSAGTGGQGGGIANQQAGTLNIKNSIIDDNSVAAGGVGPDIAGNVASQDYNLIGNISGATIGGTTAHDIYGQDARLGPLQNNGGPTRTHALLAGSPALDAGNNALIPNDTADLDANGIVAEPIPYDQRGEGFRRVVDSADADVTATVDMGAYEAQVSVEDIPDKATNEDTTLSFSFNVGGAFVITSVTATSSNTTLVPNNPANLSVTGTGSTRTLNITPVANLSGTTTITVTVNGPNSQSMTDTFVLTVNAVNDAPQAVNDSYSTNENTALNVPAPGVLTNDTDIDSASLTAVLVTNASHGTVVLNSNGSFTYTPQAGFSGADSFTYKANDGSLDSNIATVNITVNEGGTLQFDSATYTVAENGGNAVITITRTGGSNGTATVLFQTSNGTAGSGDYSSVSTTVTFNQGETSKTVSVPITDDSADEADETVNLTLSNAGGTGQLGTPATAVLTITDNDATPSISINDVSITEGDSGTKNAVFTVTLSAASNLVVSVSYQTANGTAVSSSDYQAASGTVVFNPGDPLTKTITVVINGDTANEHPSETFFVNLSNPQNATISDGQGQGTIVDDDAPGVEFISASHGIDEENLRVLIRVRRTGDLSQPLKVDYQTFDQAGVTPCQTNNTGFASHRCDYATAAGTLRFAAGEQEKIIQVLLIDDTYTEPPEEFSVKLSNPQGGSLGSIDTTTVTILNFNESQTPAGNPIDSLDYFIRQLYVDFLGREPEPEGLFFWRNRMTGNCPQGQTCDRIDTAIRFFQSDEFGLRGYFVYLFYHASLGRRPTYAEWMMDVSKLNGFQTLAEQQANREAFINEFINRTEFRNLYDPFQTGEEFVNALIQRSGVTPASRQQLIANYATVGRAKTLQAFIETPEVRQAFFDRGFITMLYFGYLRRDAEPGGFDFWMQKLIETNHDYRFLTGGFLQSDEFRYRFGNP